MRLLLLSVPLLLLAGCGGASERQESSEDLQTYDAAESAAPSAPAMMPPPPSDVSERAAAGPNVGPTAAPGVAFNYRYAFRLPAQRIAEVQEAHAAACERLGTARCRITGLRYRVVNDRDIEAMLAFKLDPTIARHFGRAGVEAVAAAEGMLTESEISGTDVGTAIRAAGRSIAQMNEELARIERRLAQRGLPAAERTRLEFEAQQLRQSIRAVGANREEQEESLATTPMVFQYGSGHLVPGFDEPLSFGGALERGLENLGDIGIVLLLVLITVLPWVLLALLIWWGVQSVRRRMSARAGHGERPDEPVAA